MEYFILFTGIQHQRLLGFVMKFPNVNILKAPDGEISIARLRLICDKCAEGHRCLSPVLTSYLWAALDGKQREDGISKVPLFAISAVLTLHCESWTRIQSLASMSRALEAMFKSEPVDLTNVDFGCLSLAFGISCHALLLPGAPSRIIERQLRITQSIPAGEVVDRALCTICNLVQQNEQFLEALIRSLADSLGSAVRAECYWRQPIDWLAQAICSLAPYSASPIASMAAVSDSVAIIWYV